MSQDNNELLVAPAVSRAKFDRELAEYREIETERRRLGWWILSAQFPDVLVAFTVAKLRPAPVAFGALLNFDNYDLWPPSVRVVDPFTMRTYRWAEIPQELRLQRRIVTQTLPNGAVIAQPQPMLQAHGDDEIPFFCLPGVREYHRHPAHTGDDWLLHRGRGEGTLFFILEKLYRYGVEPISSFRCDLRIQVAGFSLGNIPE